MIANYTLMLVTDDRVSDDTAFFHILEAALQGGATLVQLREKNLSTKAFYQRAKSCKTFCQRYQVPLLINDRIDIALAVDADGVHLGQSDMPVSIARQLLGANKIIGLSVSNETQAEAVNALPVDYIGLSPVFATSTKTQDLAPPLGIHGLQSIAQQVKVPIVCIGGISIENAATLYHHGAAGIAVISAISNAHDPQYATRQLLEQSPLPFERNRQ